MTTKLTRHSPGGYGAMVPDTEGDWIRYSEIKPRIEEAVETAVTNGLLAGSIIADENADELAKLRDLLRWRKVGEEMPDKPGKYLASSGAITDALFFDGKEWTDGVGYVHQPTHWRPIGPMPTTQEGGA